MLKFSNQIFSHRGIPLSQSLPRISIIFSVGVVEGAIVWRFDSSRNEWRGQKTLAYVGNLLELEKGKEGAQRDAFMVEFINQDDPFAK